jgi:cytochrome c biogenesis protein CcdA
MPSRISLSVLAFICGLAIMFIAAAYGVVRIPAAEVGTTSVIVVLIGMLAIAVGWIRIFMRRPSRSDENISD